MDFTVPKMGRMIFETLCCMNEGRYDRQGT
jgi:hypothetical protein